MSTQEQNRLHTLHNYRKHLQHDGQVFYQTASATLLTYNANRRGDNAPPCRTPQYIGWSDVTYLWSQCDRHFVCQHVVLCVVKWWRFVALFESNWISWLKKMSVLSLSYWESDFYWRQNTKHFAELAHKMAENSWYEEIMSQSPYVL